jgi:hypothetical protein
MERWSRFYDRHQNVIGMTLLVLCYVLIVAAGATYIWLAVTGSPLR